MIKKKAKGKAAKKSAKKKSSSTKKEKMNPAEVRKEIAGMVETEATLMAKAVIDEGKKGQLATVKYLFEVAEIYPPAADGGLGTEEDDCFAKQLMHRLNLPEEPIARDDEDEAVSAAVPAAKVADEEEASEAAGKDSGRQDAEAEAETGGEATVE